MTSLVNSSHVTSTTINIPSSSDQDRGKHWNIENIDIYAVCDGHGVYGRTFAEHVINYIDTHFHTIEWMNDNIEEIIQNLFVEIETSASETLSGKHGGSTVSLYIKRGDKDIWIANLGDSDIVIFNKTDNSHIVLSEDHGPSNIEEFKRMKQTHDNVIAEYDKQIKIGPVIPVFKQVDDKWTNSEIPSRNVYYKNVEGEYATYIGDGDSYKLSVTRAIGDFHFKEHFGVSSVPFIRKIEPLTGNNVIIMASDGFWDCWKYSEVTDFLQNNSIDKLEKEHSDKSNRLFGSSKDDTFVYVIS